MAAPSVLQNQFTRGELSPRMNARTDLEQYYQGGQTVLNFLPLPHGGIVSRPGSTYVSSVKTAADSTRLIPFVFNVSDSYILELGDYYMRFYRNQGQVQSGDISYTAFNGTFVSDISDWTDESPGADAAAAAWDSGTQSMKLTATASNDGIGELDLTTASAASEHTLKFKITGEAVTDTVSLRIGTATDLADIFTKTAFGNGYHTVNFTPTTASTHIQFMNEDGATTSHFVDNVDIFDNEAIELETPWAKADLFEIKWVQDADTMFFVHPSYKPMQMTRTDHEMWSLKSYTPTADPFTTAALYPAAVGFFEQRIVFGYNATNPQRLYFSQSADIQDMTTGTDAADGFVKDIFATQANPIRWIVGGVDLIVGTAGGEWVVERPASSAVTVTNFTIKRRDTSGVADTSPVEIDRRVLFMKRKGAASNKGDHLVEFLFDNDQSGEFIAPELSLLSEHITGAGIQEMAWQEKGWAGTYESVVVPHADKVLWMVRTDGVMTTLTYNPSEKVISWARQTTTGTYESVAVIPGASGDEVWCVVARTISGATARYIEFYDPDMFLDSAISGTSGSPTTAWSGLDHLEGLTVELIADGGPVGTKTVASGAVTLDVAATTLVAGIAYTPTVTVMPLEVGLRDGTGFGAATSVARVGLRLLNSVGARVTTSTRTTGVDITFRENTDNVEDPVPAFTGVKEIAAPGSWIDPTLTISQPEPLPLCILAVVMEMEAHR